MSKIRMSRPKIPVVPIVLSPIIIFGSGKVLAGHREESHRVNSYDSKASYIYLIQSSKITFDLITQAEAGVVRYNFTIS
jgi:hypothetical protein